jgi:hypothetical protein
LAKTPGVELIFGLDELHLLLKGTTFQPCQKLSGLTGLDDGNLLVPVTNLVLKPPDLGVLLSAFRAQGKQVGNNGAQQLFVLQATRE